MIANIQVLRCFAALSVLALHAQAMLNEYLSTPVKWWSSAAGVDVFFVISGFIMVYANRARDKTPAQFWLDRFVRLVPLYWIATLAFVASTYFVDYSRAYHDWTWSEVVTSLLFIPTMRSDGLVFPVLTVGWTLNYEMIFYALFGLTMFMKSASRGVMGLGAFYVGLFLFGALVENAPVEIVEMSRLIALEFVAGAGIGLAYLYVQRKKIRIGAAYGHAAVWLGVALLVASEPFAVGMSTDVRALLWGIPAVSIVAGALILERAGVTWTVPVFMVLGAASYSIYLFHEPVLEMVFRALSSSAADPGILIKIVIGGIAVTAATLAGVAAHYLIEKPVTALVRSWTKPKPPRPGATPVMPDV